MDAHRIAYFLAKADALIADAKRKSAYLTFTVSHNAIFQRGQLYAVAVDPDDAATIANRLNEFDANLRERNIFQRCFLSQLKEAPDEATD